MIRSLMAAAGAILQLYLTEAMLGEPKPTGDEDGTDQ